VGWTLARKVPAAVKERCEHDDLYQAGVIGLMNAKRLYDPSRGAWSTFAVAKIRWAMLIAAGLTRQGWEQRALTDVDWERVS
jgi:DNA-directed RNA polymerase specialized sigma subunit